MGWKFFVGGNWKCNGTSEEMKKIVSTLNAGEVPFEDVVEVVVSSQFVFLPLVKSSLRHEFHVAAQNCWVKKGGAFTSEVSAEMLVNLGIPWVILGHSERRAHGSCCMLAAAVMEKIRHTQLPAPVFWLFPQFSLCDAAETFTFVGLMEFFYNQATDSARSLSNAVFLIEMGVRQ